MRVVLVLAVAASVGCHDRPAEKASKGSAAPPPTAEEVRASCEAVRDKYLAWRAALNERALASGGAALEETAARAMDNAKAHFIEVCTSIGWVIDVRCFDTPPTLSGDEKERCDMLGRELAMRLLPPPKS